MPWLTTMQHHQILKSYLPRNGILWWNHVKLWATQHLVAVGVIIFTEYFLFGMFSNAVWDLFFVENDMHKSHSSGEDKKEKNVVLNSTFFFCLWHVLKFWDLQLGEEGAKPSISLNQSTMRRGPSPVLAFPPPSEYSRQYKPSILFFHGPVHFGKPLLLSRRQNLLKFPSHPTNLQAPNFSSCTIIRFVIIILTVIILE